MKISRLTLDLASSVNGKLADNFLKLLSENYGAPPTFLNGFRTVKDMQSFTLKHFPAYHLRKT